MSRRRYCSVSVFAVAVEQVGRARVHVAAGADQKEALVQRGRPEFDLAAGQPRRQERVVGLERLVLPRDALPVVHVDRREQVVGAVGEQRAAEVHALHRVRLHHRLGARLHVEQRQAHQVRVALVGLEVDAGAVLVELHRAARLEDAAGVDLRQLVAGIDPQHLGVAVLGRARHQAQLPFQIEDVARDPLGVPRDERPLARRDLHLVEVVPRRVAVVEADEDRVGVGLRHGVDGRADVLRLGEVLRGGHVRPLRQATPPG